MMTQGTESSRNSAHLYQNTRCHNPGDENRQLTQAENITRMIKLRYMKWAVHVALMQT